MIKYCITINNCDYIIPSLYMYNNIKNTFLDDIINDKYHNDNNLYISYYTIFTINNKIDFKVYIANRNYIIDLIDNINNEMLLFNLKKINI